MFRASPSTIMHNYKKSTLGSAANDSSNRDMMQSHRLHEPAYRISNIDPMTGDDIIDTSRHPSIVDGNLTIYFATDLTRKAFIDTPLNHPYSRLPFPATDSDDRGG